MGGWIVIVFGVCLLIFTLISNANLNTAKRFEAEGQEAVAIVLRKYQTESRDADGDTTVTNWLILEYSTRRGEKITLTRTAGSSEYERAKVQEEFELRYLASEPRKTELTPGSYRSGSRITQGIALVLGLIWLGLLWKIGGWSVSAVRARRFGAREEAVVTEVRRTGVKVNNRPRYRLVWQDAHGREGTSLMRRMSELKSFRPGDHIEIYQGAKHSWWVGDVGERPEYAK